MTGVIRILGVDPGSGATGWGLIESHGARLSFLAAGVIRPKRALTRAGRLAAIHEGLAALIAEWTPAEAAVEETFVNASPRDALVLGEARGVALLAPALAGISVSEYAANTIKKSVVGKGHAEKGQVQAMVRVLLPASGEQAADAADALAVAICHAHHRGARAFLGRASTRHESPDSELKKDGGPSSALRTLL
jgi:crossover junction endodeoxyribonuclease RuvC